MTSISQSWLDRRQEIEEIPQTKGLVINIEGVHKGLALTVVSPSENQQIREIVNKILSKDNRHDNLLRVGFSHCITLAAYAASKDDDEEENSFLNLRKFLYEKGMGGTVLPYDEQEGVALRLEGRLDATMRARLTGILIQLNGVNVTLLSIVEAQIATAKEIWALEKQRRALEAAPDSTPKPSDLRRARNAWIEAARAFETNLKLAVQAQTTTQEKANSLLEELHKAGAEASKEAAEKKKG
jgi:hypothetical protein